MTRQLSSRTPHSIVLAISVVVVFALLGQISFTANAATINYGDFGPVPPGVMFLDVEESSGTDAVPLYGPPTPFSVGLDFEPTNFVASTAGGGADITDGQLNFTVMSNNAITSLNLFEAGDYTVAGTGTPATQVFAGAILRATVTAINGVPVAPIVLTPSNATFADALPPSVVVAPWSLGVSVNVAAQLGPGQAATKIDVAINNQMVAVSEPLSAAFIAKKEFIFEVDVVPEPSTVALLSLALCLIGFWRNGRG